MMSIIVYMMIL